LFVFWIIFVFIEGLTNIRTSLVGANLIGVRILIDSSSDNFEYRMEV